MMLCFGSNELIRGFSLVDFTGDIYDHKSTSGHVFLFGGGTISWSRKKQTCVARYTMEAEYIVCSIATTYVIWAKSYINDLRLELVKGLINVFGDNKSTISSIKSGTNSSKGKQIDVIYCYI